MTSKNERKMERIIRYDLLSHQFTTGEAVAVPIIMSSGECANTSATKPIVASEMTPEQRIAFYDALDAIEVFNRAMGVEF